MRVVVTALHGILGYSQHTFQQKYTCDMCTCISLHSDCTFSALSHSVPSSVPSLFSLLYFPPSSSLSSHLPPSSPFFSSFSLHIIFLLFSVPQ